MANNKRQLKLNFYSNIGALISNVIVGIMYVPYLIEHLGKLAYGVIPLALIINQYINVLSGSLTSSLTRFYSVSIHQGKAREASKSISTALVIVFVLSILVVLLAILISSNIDSIFTIPSKLINSAKVLFFFTICSLSLSMCSSVMNVTIYAQNRLDLLNVIRSLRIILKFLFVGVFFYTYGPDISSVGIANFGAELIILILSFSLFVGFGGKKLKISLKFFDKTILWAVLGMTIWVIVHQIGDVGIYRIDIFSVNKLWGVEDSGALGAISEFNTYVMMIISLVASLFGPMILIAYSKGDHEMVKGLAQNRSYISGVLAAILAGTIAGLSPSILRVWLGEEFQQYHLWMSMKMVCVPFFAAGGVLAFVYRSWKKVKAPAITTLLLGLLNVLIIVTSAMFFKESLSVEIIVLLCVIFGVLQSYYMNVFFVEKIYGGTKSVFLWASLKFSGVFILAFIIGKASELFFSSKNLIELFLILGVSVFVVSVLAFFVFLKPHHRKQLIEIIK